ncbi:MAG TPA: metal-dependent transcriptional regulator [Bacteroidetes bacterium]|nr:metal-dependent transcriptional regulator [Bacteroidota bacterium]HEX05168.1 metal-dependent transcriptional regulator [Bacteroidota bacterium]
MPHRRGKGKLSASMEDYLETIYFRDLEGHRAKVKNIADSMGVSKPSVTEALSVLRERGLVHHQKYGDIVLTAKGRREADYIYRKHRMFKRLFCDVLGVPEDQGEEDACKVEHLVSDSTVERVDNFLDFMDNGQKNGDFKLDFLEFLQTKS